MARTYEVSEALSVVIAKHPFYAVLLINLLTITETEGISTAGTDGKYLYINPKWFSKLSLPNRVFVLCHEILHVVFQHNSRSKLYKDRGIGPDLRKYNHNKANMAMDYIINRILCDNKVGEMPFDGLYHPDITANDLWDEVYCKLPDPPEDNSGHGKQGPGSGKSFDDHMDPHATQAPSPFEVQQAVKSASIAAKAQGKLPGAFSRMVDELCEPQVPWGNVLRNTLISAAGRDESTWNKPNRRKLALPPHIYLPGYTGLRTGPIGVMVDTSGSITGQELSKFFGELHSIFSDMPPEECYIVYVDAKVHGVHKVEDINELLEVARQAKGGGGTNLPVAYPALRELGVEFNAVICFTDGHTTYGDEPEWDTVWVMTTDKQAPYGKTIRIN